MTPTDRPNPIQLTRPEARPPSGSSALAVFTVVAVLGGGAMLLLWAQLGVFGPFVLGGAAVFGAILCLHYFVWGWWLPKILKQEEASEHEHTRDA